jgi:hypothetical protein
LPAGGNLEIELRLTPTPLPLDTLLVSVRRGPPLREGQQLIFGRLLDDDTWDGIEGATVHLLDGLGADAARVLTDGEGLFRLISPRPGTYTLRAERIGYRTSDSPELHLMLGDTIGLDFHLSTEAVLLAPITVTASARAWADRTRLVSMEGFLRRYERFSRSGFGEFLTRDQLIEWEGRVSSLGRLLSLTATAVTGFDPVTGSVEMRRGGDKCSPTYFVDGAPWPFPADWFPASLEAVEVYEEPQIPPEFNRGLWPCGVIAVWTRR